MSKGIAEIVVQTSGGPQSLVCLRLDLMPLWLASIPSGRIKASYKEKLLRYQTEAAEVLWQAFRPQILQEAAPLNEESNLAIVQLEQIVEQSKATQRMAEEQIALIRRVDAAARLVKGIQHDVSTIQVRLDVLEERVSPSSYVTDAQASEILSAVQAIAMALSQRDPAKNHFQGIHGELHRRFGTTSYKLIRQEQCSAVLAFLTTWSQAIATEQQKQLPLE